MLMDFFQYINCVHKYIVGMPPSYLGSRVACHNLSFNFFLKGSCLCLWQDPNVINNGLAMHSGMCHRFGKGSANMISDLLVRSAARQQEGV